MGSSVRIIFVVTAAGALAWAFGLRFHPQAVKGSPVVIRSASNESVMMKDGQVYAGRVTEETPQQIMLEIEKGVVIGLPAADVRERTVSEQKAMPVIQGPQRPWFSYEPGKNYFKGVFDEVSRLYHGLFDSYETPEERKAHAKRWAAGMRWQTGGREEFQKTVDDAARRALGPYAKHMDAPAARDYKEVKN